MAQTDLGSSGPPLPDPNFRANIFRKLFGGPNGAPAGDEPPPQDSEPGQHEPGRTDHARRPRDVVPGLPRVQTFKRQQSERRNNLAPVQPTQAERRAVSVDRRGDQSSHSQSGNPRSSAPDLFDNGSHYDAAQSDVADTAALPGELASPPEEQQYGASHTTHTMSGIYDSYFGDDLHDPAVPSTADAHSMTTSQYDAMIHIELERTWILNLSMHFRDRSKREKFFVTYRETPTLWRRVTISLDYRSAPENSLEADLQHTKFQREKSAKIYEAIRESLADIQFYDTVTNLKLQTTEGRLHVHVVEDVNEIIHYPTVQQVQHLGCRRVREQDIEFDSHMSGFVYKVHVGGEVLIKKEIPGPDTIDEFLYEINALNRLRCSRNVIRFYGVVVDDNDQHVKGLLISYAERGALIDIIYESQQESEPGIPWPTRERWARQIVQGLMDVHECGFVQGDFTLSNIVIGDDGDAKIIDINRRGCPVGWEPPEATPLIECNQRISMYIGVKSDLYQLGMVLWALATQEDEPEGHGRPLTLGPETKVPDWYRRIVEICLSEDPRWRKQASELLGMFPEIPLHSPPAISINDGYSEYLVGGGGHEANGFEPRTLTVEPPKGWPHVNMGQTYADSSVAGDFAPEPYHYTRGRSPPSPLPSHSGRWGSPGRMGSLSAWAASRKDIRPSYSDVGPSEAGRDEPEPESEPEHEPSQSKSVTPTTNRESTAAPEKFGDRLEKLQRALDAADRQTRELSSPAAAPAAPGAAVVYAGAAVGPLDNVRDHDVDAPPVVPGSTADQKDDHLRGTSAAESKAEQPGNTAPEPLTEMGSSREDRNIPSRGPADSGKAISPPPTPRREAPPTTPPRQLASPTSQASPGKTPVPSAAGQPAPAVVHAEPETARDDGAPAPASASAARNVTPRPTSATDAMTRPKSGGGSPKAELPELVGVGAAYVDGPELRMPDTVMLEDDEEDLELAAESLASTTASLAGGAPVGEV